MSRLIQNDYSYNNIKYIFKTLKRNGTFNFKPLNNGLYPAAAVTDQNKYTNYDKVWVRDNFYVAFAHYQNGKAKQAKDTLYALSDFFFKYKSKFTSIISGKVDYSNAMSRPHIRFDGVNLVELKEEWSHAQNDALGYYLWLICKMYNSNDIQLRDTEIELFPLLIKYFKTIKYWKDEDSGHWEETRKVESSSIGTVLCALVEARKCVINAPALRESCKKTGVDSKYIDELIIKGKNALNSILPFECNQNSKTKYREVDAALLFLIYPMCLFEKEILDNVRLADIILNNAISKLEGEYGIKRYIGDSFWTADAKKKQTQSLITGNYSTKIEERNRDHKIGNEAQWCIFDSIISIIYGNKYKKTKSAIFLNQQIHYFNRALSQISGGECPFGEYKCPELYYIEDGRYIYNDTVPLLWAQANLWLAFYEIKKNVLLNKDRFDILKKFRFGLDRHKLAFSLYSKS
ncbi:MAG: phosphorylase kinase [Bacteroidales bacterium]|nr:MAG: phosphorylase kinase [Bacteroidales bacterium]